MFGAKQIFLESNFLLTIFLKTNFSFKFVFLF